MSPDYVDVQSYFAEENPGIEIVDTIPSALSGEHGIVRFDSNGNSFFEMNSDIIMYTCYENGIMVTLWNLA